MGFPLMGVCSREVLQVALCCLTLASPGVRSFRWGNGAGVPTGGWRVHAGKRPFVLTLLCLCRRGAGGVIPPGATLLFDVRLVCALLSVAELQSTLGRVAACQTAC
jgi:hypothetical protein